MPLKFCLGILFTIIVMIVPLLGYLEPGNHYPENSRLVNIALAITVPCMFLLMLYSKKISTAFLRKIYTKICTVIKQKDVLVLLVYLLFFILCFFLLRGNLILDI